MTQRTGLVRGRPAVIAPEPRRTARANGRGLLAGLLLSAGAAGGASATDAAVPVADQAPAEHLYDLIDQRLELMDQVAAFKHHHGLPVEDRQREAVVLEAAVADALRLGFTPESSRAFFAAQIEAAKQIQRHWIRTWDAGASPPEPVDLDQRIRPRLLTLGTRLLSAAADTPNVDQAAFDRAVQVEGLSADASRDVFRALAGLEQFRDRLQQILAVGVLRVGTTGDYAPFSHRGDDSQMPEGVDIDLARRLADALQVEVAFVGTSWATLLDDLSAGHFDIAMSGVSRTLDRQKVGYLSTPYYVGGKTPIARCEEAERFTSLDAVNRPGVRVIVNPGGTNEAFVDTHLNRVTKVLHPDNRTIFAALAAGRADVMITDRIEVELQTARDPQLCATMSETLTYQEKAFLLPADGRWKEFVDTWLDLAMADGTVAALFREHGVEPRLPGARTAAE